MISRLRVFALGSPFWETALLATAVYLAVVITIRIIPKRHSGSLSPNDMIASVMIGSLATMGMGLHAKSVGDFLLMIGVVLFWGYIFNLLEFYFPGMRHLAQDHPTPLVRNGRVLRRNIKHEMVTEEELLACIREHGFASIDEVKEAVMEADGTISVVGVETENESTKRKKPNNH